MVVKQNKRKITYRIFFTAENVSPDLMWVEVPVIANSECFRFFPPFWVAAPTICTSGAGGRGICHVSYVKRL
jgi:hypothetical protein